MSKNMARLKMSQLLDKEISLYDACVYYTHDGLRLQVEWSNSAWKWLVHRDGWYWIRERLDHPGRYTKDMRGCAPSLMAASVMAAMAVKKMRRER